MSTAPKRRWFSFSLRTMFVIVTLFGCWLGYELNWIRQRDALVAKNQALDLKVEHEEGAWALLTFKTLRAPGLLWMFGEEPLSDLEIIFIGDGQRPLTAEEQRELERAKNLFPEATVTWRIAKISGQ